MNVVNYLTVSSDDFFGCLQCIYYSILGNSQQNTSSYSEHITMQQAEDSKEQQERQKYDVCCFYC